jgi:hypothetical protein
MGGSTIPASGEIHRVFPEWMLVRRGRIWVKIRFAISGSPRKEQGRHKKPSLYIDDGEGLHQAKVRFSASIRAGTRVRIRSRHGPNLNDDRSHLQVTAAHRDSPTLATAKDGTSQRLTWLVPIGLHGLIHRSPIRQSHGPADGSHRRERAVRPTTRRKRSESTK